ncbi:hypothetical protein [Acidicapsa ligni]|uniref:hypothetical protein n=1 Tax=Acidicapsa ligni TaxID=542300 RepID=UPI0021E0AA11|nr:hypothetical protein [Acidicapsa ligni]
MRILVGGVDYSGGLDVAYPLRVVRKLNEPSTCQLWVVLLPGSAPGVPLRNQSLVVTGDDGTVYFTGYLAVSPLAEYAGLGVAGPVYRWALQAVSDEILLDTQLLPPSAGTTGASVGSVVARLVERTGSSALRTAGLTLGTAVGHFVPAAGAKWSEAAGQVATQARAAYRAVSGALTLTQVGSTVHSLSESAEGAGTLELAALTLTPAVDRALANDVTVCGADEPVAYVTEYLLGDGVTLDFPLAEVPYFGSTSGSGASGKVIYELFQEAAIDLRRWSYSGHEGFYSITGNGLTIDGGTGVDGEAALVWTDGVEAGGTLLYEAVGVSLSPGSTGILAGLYGGAILAANCVAGFAVTAAVGTGVVSVAALVQGVVAGASYVLNAANQYTLRVRLHCPEVERVTQAYRVVGDAGLVEFGGGGVVAPLQLLLEVQEFVNGVAGMPVALYDGAAGFAPGSYQAAVANSVNLIGTIRSVFLNGLGSGWVLSTVPGGGPRTRRVGTLADAAECHLTRTGSLTFYTGMAPILGEVVVVNYRTVGRAVGRAVNAASQAALAGAGMPATAVWTGTVTGPAARSSRDCRNAAQALVTAASSVSAAWSGSYKTWNIGLDGDVWPGDALLLSSISMGLDVQVAVRSVTVEYAASSPDVVAYAIAFSNDWANDLSIKTSKSVPVDAWLPAAIAPTYLANLSGLAVTRISPAAVTVATNATAPAGGGFEVRRRDFAFQPGVDADLVMRSAVGNFDIPRATEADRFYVRMYDGSTPPNYSEFSVGLFVNLPLSTTLGS